MPKHREIRSDEPDAQKTRVPSGCVRTGHPRRRFGSPVRQGTGLRLAPGIFPVRTATRLLEDYEHRP